MSLTTRCPACGTMFKVVPDQLKISDGWVRCGHCADVFDATLYLETWTPSGAENSPSAKDAQAAAPESLGIAEEDNASDRPAWPAGLSSAGANGSPTSRGGEPWKVHVPAAPEADAAGRQSLGRPAGDQGVWTDPPAAPVLPSAVTRGVSVAAPAAEPVSHLLAADPDAAAPAGSRSRETSLPSGTTPVEAQESDFHTELQRFAAQATGIASNTDDAGTGPAAVSDPPPRRETDPEPVSDGLTADALEPGFMRQARRRAFWTSPGMRVLLSLLVLLLSVLLGGQWVLHQRDQLAASHPQWTPLLSRLCEPLGCEIGAVRQIDAIVIDSSSLVRRLGNFYSFDFVLKNTGSMPLALPALELSLTDTRDAVIARRVFLPEDLPGVPALLPARDSVTVSLRLSMAVGDALPMAGYRALVFYP